MDDFQRRAMIAAAKLTTALYKREEQDTIQNQMFVDISLLRLKNVLDEAAKSEHVTHKVSGEFAYRQSERAFYVRPENQTEADKEEEIAAYAKIAKSLQDLKKLRVASAVLEEKTPNRTASAWFIKQQQEALKAAMQEKRPTPKTEQDKTFELGNSQTISFNRLEEFAALEEARKKNILSLDKKLNSLLTERERGEGWEPVQELKALSAELEASNRRIDNYLSVNNEMNESVNAYIDAERSNATKLIADLDKGIQQQERQISEKQKQVSGWRGALKSKKQKTEIQKDITAMKSNVSVAQKRKHAQTIRLKTGYLEEEYRRNNPNQVLLSGQTQTALENERKHNQETQKQIAAVQTLVRTQKQEHTKSQGVELGLNREKKL